MEQWEIGMYIRLISVSQEKIVLVFSAEFKIELRSGAEFG